MAKQFARIEEDYRKFIEKQPLFFVATAALDGKVNVSPKGMDSLRILGPNRIVWLNFTGSGNETAGHLLSVNRMTLMWCSFSTMPMIYRVYGTARAVHPFDDEWANFVELFGTPVGARQVFDMRIDMAQKSCGYAVPEMSLTRERDTLAAWAAQKDDWEAQWRKDNLTTIDGQPTGIFGDDT